MPAEVVGLRSDLLEIVAVLPARNRRSFVLCRCDCGREIELRRDKVLTGRQKSCGCRYLARRSPATHPRNNLAYKPWCAMHDRCRNMNNGKYGLYGGRGIRVCERWRDFWLFLADMGERPSRNYSIERIDNDGPYEPGNCRWATAREQGRNKRTSRYVRFNGRRRLLIDVARSVGMQTDVLASRLKLGWDLQRALTQPVRAKKRNRPKSRVKIDPLVQHGG
jgi:hypothetical protein